MATITQDVTLIFDADNNVTHVQDNTVWPSINGESYNVLLDMKGIGTLTNPSGGTVFSATSPLTPLIDLAAGTTSSIDYNLPTTSGAIVNGTYPFTYSSVGSIDYTTTFDSMSSDGYVLVYDEGVSYVVLQAGDSITIADNTTNPSANGTWVVIGVETTSNPSISKVFLSGFLEEDASPDGAYSFSISRTFTTTLTATYTGCTKVTPKITFTSQPYTGEFGTLIIADSTDYSGVTLTDNSITVKYPDGLVPAPSVDPLIGNDVLSVTITQVGTGTYTITLDGTVTQEVATGFEVIYTLAGIRVKGKPVNVFERVVVWRDGLCCLYDCLNIVFEKHNRFVLAGQESPYTAAVADLALAVDLYLIAVQCGVQEDIESSYAAITAILETTDCSCDCGCGDSNTPVWISNSSLEGANLITALQDEIDAVVANVVTLQTNVNTLSDNVETLFGDVADLTTEVNSKVASVTGAIVDNTDPQNPTISISVNEDNFSGDGSIGNPLSLVGLDASAVVITPAISGLTATDGQSAFSELQTSKLETVAVDGVTITGDGTVGNPLVAAGGGGGPLVYAAQIQFNDSAAPTATVISNTIGNIVWSRNLSGVYIGVLTGAFPAGKTLITQSYIGALTYENPVMALTSRNNANVVRIDTILFLGDPAIWIQNDVVALFFIKIEVYP